DELLLAIVGAALGGERSARRILAEQRKRRRPPDRTRDRQVVLLERRIGGGDDQKDRLAGPRRRAMRGARHDGGQRGAKSDHAVFRARAGTSASMNTASSASSTFPRLASELRMSSALSCGTAFLYGRSAAVRAS